MKRPTYRLKEEYDGLPQYALVTPINPDYLSKELKDEFQIGLLNDRYGVYSTGKGLKLIRNDIVEVLI